MTDINLVKELMETMHSLHRSMHKIDFHEDCTDLSLLQMHTLRCVQERGSCSMKELAEQQKIVPATMTALVERLVKKDLLVRTPDPEDRRVVRVSLSATGEETLKAFYLEKQRRVALLLGILDDSEQRTLVDLMKKIETHFLAILAKKE